MQPPSLVLVTLWTVALAAVGEIDGGWSRQQLDQYDTMGVARCVAKCWTVTKKENDACLSVCLAGDYVKPGACPDVTTLSVFDAACIDACQNDAQCPATDKCCSNTCGVTCQPTLGLDAVPGLPHMPGNITVSERRRGRQVLIEWSGQEEQDDQATPVVYLLEERHHVGRHFSASRLSSWQQKHKPTTRTNLVLKHSLRPGRWYQFRLAAINERGTQGFSEPSQQFSLSIAPKAPRAPEKLAVTSLSQVNGSYVGELSWSAPSSDLPIQRYKVFWSRQLQGASGPLVSVLVNHQTVGKDVTKFSLKHLEADSMYFLQVQALAQYGRERLKGEKTALVLNTTMQSIGEMSSPAPADGGSKRSVSRISNLRVQRMFWRDSQLLARLVWAPGPGHRSRYTVTWATSTCQGNANSKQVQLAATTDSPSFDVYDLNFQCKYRVTVKQHGAGQQQEATLSFATPTCEQMAESIKRQAKPTCPLNTAGEVQQNL